MSDTRLNRIEDKIDQVLESQSEMNADLKYHIKRTDILEKHVSDLQRYVYMGLGIAAVAAVLAKTLL